MRTNINTLWFTHIIRNAGVMGGVLVFDTESNVNNAANFVQGCRSQLRSEAERASARDRATKAVSAGLGEMRKLFGVIWLSE